MHCTDASWKWAVILNKNRTAWTVFFRSQWDIWRWQVFVLLTILSTNQQTEVFLALPFRCRINVRGTLREGLGEIRTAWNGKHEKKKCANVTKLNHAAWWKQGKDRRYLWTPCPQRQPVDALYVSLEDTTGGNVLAPIVVPDWLAGFWPWHILAPTLHCSYPSCA